MKNNISFTQDDINYLLSPKAVRDGAKKVYDYTLEGKGHFSWHEDKLEDVCDYVLETIKINYPELNIPFHSRWGHFKVGGVDRVQKLSFSADSKERCRSLLELVITSVLLDAGAGNTWSFKEESTGQDISRSEGLAVASLYLFEAGAFSSDDSEKLRADAKGLMSFSENQLIESFQVSEENPLLGVEGRVNLLNSLGKAIESHPEFFKDGRLGNILDYMLENFGDSFTSADLLQSVLKLLGSIWPGRIMLGETNLGDVWMHSSLGGQDLNSLVPFHKLSQWLTYSLMEPMMELGLTISDLDLMTGLPEYRNGGLLIDLGLISLNNTEELTKDQSPESDLVIEWRGLTVMALDMIGAKLCEKLGKTNVELPLVKVLEGGTWHAGRRIAKEKREDGRPPLNIVSDGTVF